jgi:hypothetical protein
VTILRHELGVPSRDGVVIKLDVLAGAAQNDTVVTRVERLAFFRTLQHVERGHDQSLNRVLGDGNESR